MNYFQNNPLGEEIWRKKYKYKTETPEDTINRISTAFTDIEATYSKPIKKNKAFNNYINEKLITPLSYDTIKECFHNFKYIIPGGSVLSGIGTDEAVSLSNCFLANSPEDNMESIFSTALEIANISKRRGGCGIDISNLRPNGSDVNNSAKTSSGAVSFMTIFNSVLNTIGQNNRRAAGMISIDCNHPDLEEFIDSKTDLTKNTGANISVKISDDFMNAVYTDSDYIQVFPINTSIDFLKYTDITQYEYNVLNKQDNIYFKRVQAKRLWDKLIENNWKSAEPGILFWDTHLHNDPSALYEKYKPVGTNPCIPGSSKLLTKNGLRKLDDLTVGSVIWSKEGWTTIINKQCSGTQPIKRFYTPSGTFIGTKEHKIISNEDKIKACDAKSIDSIVCYDIKDTNLCDNDIINGIFLISNLLDDNSKLFSLRTLRSKLTISYTPKEKHLIKIPDTYFYGDSTKVRGFLRGLFSINGSIKTNPAAIEFKTTSVILKDQLIILLSSIGIHSIYRSYSDKKDQKYYKVIIKTDIERFAKLIGFPDCERHDKLSLLSKKSKQVKIDNTIIKIVSEPDELVYDITVDNKSHTYWLEGLDVANCGEIPLSSGDSCRLMTINLPSFINNPFTDNASFDINKFKEVVYIATKLCDDLIDAEINNISKLLQRDITPQERKWWEQTIELGRGGRRAGLGITGLMDTIAMLCVENKSLELVIENIKNIFKLFMSTQLTAQYDLAIYRGTFPDYKKELSTHYLKTIETILKDNNHNLYSSDLAINTPCETIINKLLESGLRNISWSTIAPTGSISLLANNCSSGIEPIFSIRYIRRIKLTKSALNYDFIDVDGEKYKNEYIIHPYFVQWFSNFILTEKSTIYHTTNKLSYEEVYNILSTMNEDTFNDLVLMSPYANLLSNSIDINTRIKIQSIAQKYITHSISSTINVPNTYTKEQIDHIYKESYLHGLKGVTIYRDGSRGGVLISNNSTTNNSNLNIITTNRPSIIDCDIKRFTNGNESWIAFIGIHEGMPYEIFTGINDLDSFPIPTNIIKGKIIKTLIDDKSRYDFIYKDKYNEDVIIRGLSNIFNKEYWNYARLISGYLRAKINLEEIINIVSKMYSDNQTINSWKNGIIRSLKQYLNSKQSNQKCPECGEPLVVEGGCIICKSCTYTVCS